MLVTRHEGSLTIVSLSNVLLLGKTHQFRDYLGPTLNRGEDQFAWRWRCDLVECLADKTTWPSARVPIRWEIDFRVKEMSLAVEKPM